MSYQLRRAAIRLSVVLVTLATVLVPAIVAPASTISIPRTLTGKVSTDGDRSVTFRFTPTHVAFSWTGREGTGVEFSLDGTEWTEATEAHDLEDGSRHYSGIFTVARPDGLRWRPIGRGVSDVTVDYLNTVDGPKITKVVPATATASASTPAIVSRAEWLADESIKKTSGGCKRDFSPLQQIFVHHTAGSNYDYDPEATMRAIYAYHVKLRGYCDIAYNFVIGWDGRVYEGRWARNYGPWEVPSSENPKGEVVVAAHTKDFNTGSVGVALMGNFVNVGAPKVMKDALVGLLAWEVDRHDLDPTSKHSYVNPATGKKKWLPVVAGHRDAGQTACPGGKVYDKLPRFRKRIAALAAPGKDVPKVVLGASDKDITKGEATTLTAQLTDSAGTAMVSQPLTIWVKRSNGWAVKATGTTDGYGQIHLDVAPRKNTKFRAVYDGSEFSWGAQSSNLKVRVAEASP
ncbi:MAG: hypothetical protein GEU71_15870 [Actinobacteria bacterium]|nr:hypothetical protein [Actinomycetota bacterium]